MEFLGQANKGVRNLSVTFSKLFSSITESTIWGESDRTRIVWITMLAMADRKGRVWGSIPGLANRARVPLQACEKALTTFLSPDKYSRTTDYEGKRIAEIDGGWLLLNYEKHRAKLDEESVKESKRRYMRDRRAREKEVARGEESPHKSTSSTVETSRSRSRSSKKYDGEKSSSSKLLETERQISQTNGWHDNGQ